jgi:4-amino-4-deoxy-L-arabinose transferase-like glycosyltransferase
MEDRERSASATPGTLRGRLAGSWPALGEAISQFAEGRVLRAPMPLVFVAVVFAANLLLNMLNGEVGYDDREQLAHMATWAWGYSGVQPPLHTWVVKLLVPLFGDGIDAVYAARFLVLILLFAVMHAAARLMGLSREAAVAAALGLFLLPQIGWEAQRSFSHSLTGLLGAASSLAALYWALRDGGRLPYAALGLAAAVAILGKYNGAILLLGLALGTAMVPFLARRIRPRRLLLSLAVFSAATAGPAIWLASRLGTLDDSAHKFEMGGTASPVLDRLAGFGSLLLAIGAYAGVLLGLVLLALPRGGRRRALRDARGRLRADAPSSLLLGAMGASLGLLALGLAVAGATNVETYWLHPILVFAPLAVSAAFDGVPDGRRVNRVLIGCGMLVALLTLLVFAVRATSLA